MEYEYFLLYCSFNGSNGGTLEKDTHEYHRQDLSNVGRKGVAHMEMKTPTTTDEFIKFIESGDAIKSILLCKMAEAKFREIIDFPAPIVDIGGVDGIVLRNIARNALQILNSY